jgi:ferredoxin-type protein NapH
MILGTVLLLVAILGIPIITLSSMPGLISSQMADAIFWGSVGIEISLIAIIITLEIGLSSRFWCKYFCPVGATLALVRSKKTLRIHYTASKCSCETEHLPCNMACPIHLDPRRKGIYPYCYNCGECVDACRSYGQALNYTLKSEKIISVEERKTG